MEMAIGMILFAIIGPPFYRAMDRLEGRIRREWKDSLWKRIVLFDVKGTSRTTKPNDGS